MDERKIIVRGILSGVGLFVLAVTALSRLGLVEVGLPRDGGTFFWQFSRASGATATLSLSLLVAFGLLVSTGVADRIVPRGRSMEMHQFLSTLTLSLVLAHAFALAFDGWARFDVLDVLVPFASPYRPAAVALGVFALHASVLVHVSPKLRKRIGARGFRILHVLSFPAFFLAVGHALLAQSDSASWFMRVFLGACVALVLWLVFYRVFRAWAEARTRMSEPSPTLLPRSNQR